jgi:hypothetical protein
MSSKQAQGQQQGGPGNVKNAIKRAPNKMKDKGRKPATRGR